jgi:hypothetical protein
VEDSNAGAGAHQQMCTRGGGQTGMIRRNHSESRPNLYLYLYSN